MFDNGVQHRRAPRNPFSGGASRGPKILSYNDGRNSKSASPRHHAGGRKSCWTSPFSILSICFVAIYATYSLLSEPYAPVDTSKYAPPKSAGAGGQSLVLNDPNSSTTKNQIKSTGKLPEQPHEKSKTLRTFDEPVTEDSQDDEEKDYSSPDDLPKLRPENEMFDSQDNSPDLYPDEDNQWENRDTDDKKSTDFDGGDNPSTDDDEGGGEGAQDEGVVVKEGDDGADDDGDEELISSVDEEDFGSDVGDGVGGVVDKETDASDGTNKKESPAVQVGASDNSELDEAEHVNNTSTKKNDAEADEADKAGDADKKDADEADKAGDDVDKKNEADKLVDTANKKKTSFIEDDADETDKAGDGADKKKTLATEVDADEHNKVDDDSYKKKDVDANKVDDDANKKKTLPIEVEVDADEPDKAGDDADKKKTLPIEDDADKTDKAGDDVDKQNDSDGDKTDDDSHKEKTPHIDVDAGNVSDKSVDDGGDIVDLADKSKITESNATEAEKNQDEEPERGQKKNTERLKEVGGVESGKSDAVEMASKKGSEVETLDEKEDAVKDDTTLENTTASDKKNETGSDTKTKENKGTKESFGQTSIANDETKGDEQVIEKGESVNKQPEEVDGKSMTSEEPKELIKDANDSKQTVKDQVATENTEGNEDKKGKTQEKIMDKNDEIAKKRNAEEENAGKETSVTGGNDRKEKKRKKKTEISNGDAAETEKGEKRKKTDDIKTD